MTVLERLRDTGARTRIPWPAAAGLGAIGIAIALMALVCAMGPSNTVPTTGGGLHLGLKPSVTVVVALDWTAQVLGALGVGLGLLALRRGWCPAPGRLLAAGLLALAPLAVLPLAGSTDALSYAVYGRMAVLGRDPAGAVPWDLIRLDDPVARFAPLSWRHTPSVYGPVANWIFQGAALLGGASMAKITFIWKLLAAAAFGLAAIGLDRLAGPDPVRRARVHLLWTLNPLMIWAVVVGAHVDGPAAACVVGALLALHRRDGASTRMALAAGLLIGLAAGIKAPFALAGLGVAWGLRRDGTRLTAVLAGAAATLGLAYLAAGASAVRVLTSKTDSFSPVNPWRWPLRLIEGDQWASAPMGLIGLVAGVLMAGLLVWRLPPGPPALPAVRPMFALCAAWLITSPLQRPWYDAMLFPLLALMPASRMDGVLLLRGTVAGFGFLPGVPSRGPEPWPGVMRWIMTVFVPWRVSAATLAMVALAAVALVLPPRVKGAERIRG